MKLETKFDVGQRVYFMSHNKVQNAIVLSIDICVSVLSSEYSTHKTDCIYTLDYRETYNSGFERVKEDVLFGSKQDLLNSL